MASRDVQLKAYDLLRIMSENKVQLDVCDIRNTSKPFYLKEKLQVKPKTSASPSEVFYNILEGKDGQIPASVKMFFNVTKNQTPAIHREFSGSIGGLLYEAEMYKKVLQIAWSYSPNFVSFLGFGCCKLSNIKTYTDSASWDVLQTKMKDYYQDLLPFRISRDLKIDQNTETCLLVTEKAGNGAYFGQPDASVTDLTSVWKELPEPDRHVVLFQIIYSLEVMSRFKIMHNDFHPGNILLARFSKPIVFTFIVGKKMFRINTVYVPYFFDWDFGYTASLGPNPKIDDEMKDLGIYNNFNPKFDLYTLACYLSSLDQPSPVLKGYDMEVFHTQEERDNVQLTKEEYNALLSLPVYKRVPVDERQVDLYRQPTKVMNELLARLNPPGRKFPADSILVYYLLKTGTPKYFLMYWKGFGCRMTSMSRNFPTPLQLLETKFTDLEIPLTKGFPKNKEELMKNYPGGEKSHIYRLPTDRNVQVKLRSADVDIDPNTGAAWDFV
jgi:serine/threonine protein kinase